MKTIIYHLTIIIALLAVGCVQEEVDQAEIIPTQEPLDGKKPVAILTSSKIDLPTQEEALDHKTGIRNKIFKKSLTTDLNQLATIEIVQLIEQGASQKEIALAYEEYGDNWVKKQEYSAAINAYKEAEEIRETDMKQLYLKLAKTYALNGEYYGSMEDCLKQAKALGFEDYKVLLYDEAFEGWRKKYDFVDGFGELFGKGQEMMFNVFIALGNQKNLIKDYTVGPMELFENTEYAHRERVGYYKNRPVIRTHFENFVEGLNEDRFSREGGDDYRYEMVLANNKNYVAVIYSKEEVWSEYILPKEYQLVTYDRKGNKVAALEIAKRGALKRGKGFVLHPDHTFEITNYKLKWKNSAKERCDQEGTYLKYEDLKMAEAEERTTYKISATGQIIPTEGVLLGMR
ncbi:hypothetical protein [Aureispira anguillae]|uniref:Lipoprotein n=1 Tax=Aureispira anguillae TaxID=2864201 RepID=A0A915YEQ0_9BACT|nr:hypothetical protein [Aureispira anguillae]BDS11670.1 hypothetical protein AsAng_0023840 [Aureispira anguillae]